MSYIHCRRVASGGAGGAMPPDFRFYPPDFFSCPSHGIFLGGRSCCYWAEKTLKFTISARKSVRISAKTFFFFWDHLCFRPKKFGKNLCPPDLILPPPLDLAKLATLLILCITPKRVTSWWGSSPRHCAPQVTQILSKKCRSGGEPLATLCLITPALDLNLRPHVLETNALPLDHCYWKNIIIYRTVI